MVAGIDKVYRNIFIDLTDNVQKNNAMSLKRRSSENLFTIILILSDLILNLFKFHIDDFFKSAKVRKINLNLQGLR